MRYLKLSIIVLFATLLLPFNSSADEKLDESAEAFRQAEQRMIESERWHEETQRRRELQEEQWERDRKIQDLEERLDAMEPFK